MFKSLLEAYDRVALYKWRDPLVSLFWGIVLSGILLLLWLFIPFPTWLMTIAIGVWGFTGLLGSVMGWMVLTIAREERSSNKKH